MTRTEHLLFIMAEECAEVAQRASKAARFGIFEVEPGQDETNLRRLGGEIADLYAAIQILMDEHNKGCTLSFGELSERMMAKREKVEKFLAYSQECGTLSQE